MPDFKGQNPARLLAPVALAVFAVIFFAVILGSGDDEGSQKTTTEKQASSRRERGKRPRQGRKASGSTYVVKTGDTLGSISQKTGVPVEQLQERNPGLDAQALVTGQKIKLRE